MNLLMMAPLCDSRGTIRYFIGAQVDVSGLVKDCAELESLQRLVDAADAHNSGQTQNQENNEGPPPKDEFQELSEMLKLARVGHCPTVGGKNAQGAASRGPGLELQIRQLVQIQIGHQQQPGVAGTLIRLPGQVENLAAFTNITSSFDLTLVCGFFSQAPVLRVPGILQSPFMAKIGGSNRVREELTQALADGRGVTAKVRWVSRRDSEGRNRWIHCTPLIG